SAAVGERHAGRTAARLAEFSRHGGAARRRRADARVAAGDAARARRLLLRDEPVARRRDAARRRRSPRGHRRRGARRALALARARARRVRPVAPPRRRARERRLRRLRLHAGSRPVRRALPTAIVLALCAADARANPIDAFGLGSLAIAMGGAATAAVDDTSANYYNPAALARGRDLRIDIGYRWAQPLLQFNGGDVGTNATRGVSAGLLLPGRIGAVRFAFGAAVWLPDQWLLRQRWMA